MHDLDAENVKTLLKKETEEDLKNWKNIPAYRLQDLVLRCQYA